MQWRAALPVLIYPRLLPGCISLPELLRYGLFRKDAVTAPADLPVPVPDETGSVPAGYRLMKVPVTGGCPVMMLPARMAGAVPHPASRLLLPVTVTAGKRVPPRLQECLFPPAARDTLLTAGLPLIQLTLRHQ